MATYTEVSMDSLSEFMEAAADLAESIMLDIKESENRTISLETIQALTAFADSAEKLTTFITALQSSKIKLN